MSLAIKEDEKLADGISRIITERVDKTLEALKGIHRSPRANGATKTSPAEAVHTARRRLKEARAAVRLVRDGLSRVYRQGRDAMEAALADGTDEAMHKWRRRAKDLRYQLEMLEPLWCTVMKATADEAHELGNQLGDDHDLAVLTDLISGDGDLHDACPKADRQALQGLVARRQESLRAHAKRIGRRIYVERPKDLRARLDAYWKALD